VNLVPVPALDAGVQLVFALALLVMVALRLRR
jgi:hypothetical protein